MARRANQASQAKQNKSQNDSPKLTFLEHFYELRKRLFWVALTLVFTTAVGLEIKDQLITVVMAPLKGGKLVYLTPGGGFNFIFTLSLYFGVLLTIPVITFQIYRFLQPMLGNTSRRFIMIFIATSSVLAALGASLAYFLAIPGALGFLSGFAGSSIVPNLTADSYLSFVVTYVVGLAALFQLPLLMFLYDHIRPIPPGFLARTQRFGIVATTILAAFITPSPDLVNYSIVLFPLLGAYEFGVLAVYLRRKLLRSRKTAEPKTEKEISAEPIIEAEPLTAIIEEIAEENNTVQPVDETSVAVEPVAAPVPQPVPTEVQTSAPLQYAPDTPTQSQPQYTYQPEAYAQPAVAPQPLQYAEPVSAPTLQAPLTTPATRARSIDGMRAPARYKTNVHVPARQPGQTSQPKKGEESDGGLLTAEA